MISAPVTTQQTALAASLAHWWALSGLDMAVGETPRNWLERERPAPVSTAIAQPTIVGAQMVERSMPAGVSSPEVATPPSPPPAPMPDDLGAFMEWLANDKDQPEAGLARVRILPHVPVDATIMIVTDMPTAEDMAAGRLFAGADHVLLTAMLRAVGLDIGKAALASLLLARPAGGIIEDALSASVALRLRHLIGLINPGSLILLGDGMSRALQQTNDQNRAVSSLTINHQAGSISAMLLPAPFILLKHAERKAAAWGQLRQLATQS